MGSTDTTNIKKACFFQEPVCLWLWFLTACIFFLGKIVLSLQDSIQSSNQPWYPRKNCGFRMSEKQQKLWTMVLESSDHAGGLHQWRRLRDLLKGRKKVGLKMQRCAACCLLGILKGLPAAGESCELDPTLPYPHEKDGNIWCQDGQCPLLLQCIFFHHKNEEERITRRGQKKKKKKGLLNILSMTTLKFSLF